MLQQAWKGAARSGPCLPSPPSRRPRVRQPRVVQRSARAQLQRQPPQSARQRRALHRPLVAAVHQVRKAQRVPPVVRVQRVHHAAQVARPHDTHHAPRALHCLGALERPGQVRVALVHQRAQQLGVARAQRGQHGGQRVVAPQPLHQPRVQLLGWPCHAGTQQLPAQPRTLPQAQRRPRALQRDLNRPVPQHHLRLHRLGRPPGRQELTTPMHTQLPSRA
mmetsp:Transcript_25715/g.65359  ORF Transcript_25715/g.65359 Transcript_25715/m.65359 type:complete len:220 (+) Transcript_25715:149-808(+)